jgi:hypothetical protein
MDLSRGTLLVLAGVGLFVTTMAVGAVTAPDRTIGATEGGPATPAGAPTASDAPTPTDGVDPGDGTATDGTPTPTATPAPDAPQTLVGMQGGWVTHGSVFKFDGHDEAWRVTNADGYFEVSVLDDGRIAAAFSNESVQTDCAPYDSPCGRTGFRIIDPDAAGGPAVVSEYSFATRRQHNREVHAVDALGGDRFAFADMDRERIVVVENGTEVWEWRASSFYDAPDDPTGRDWLHINDVDAIGDERFLVSVRNANQLLVVERGAGVVEVINADRDDSDDDICTDGPQLADFDGDGDVRCGDPDVINHQHNPQWLGPGAVLVADSDNDRVVELHRNESGVWKPAWVVRRTGGLELQWPRDADRLPNGNTLIADSRGKRIVEVDPQGTAVWSAPTDRFPYEADRLPIGESSGRYDGAATGPTASPTPTDGSPESATETPGRTETAGATETPGRTPTPTPEGLPQLTASDPDSLDDTGDDVPLLTLAVAGIQTFPQIPFWYREFHLGVTILSALLVVGGGVDALRARYLG